ncbi:MAG: hypothetical protein MI741_02320, partial [Rhodospirillales bacterium]|nr:hypothetical protein [Rhodospirillales bacterium]
MMPKHHFRLGFPKTSVLPKQNVHLGLPEISILPKQYFDFGTPEFPDCRSRNSIPGCDVFR